MTLRDRLEDRLSFTTINSVCQMEFTTQHLVEWQKLAWHEDYTCVNGPAGKGRLALFKFVPCQWTCNVNALAPENQAVDTLCVG